MAAIIDGVNRAETPPRTSARQWLGLALLIVGLTASVGGLALFVFFALMRTCC